MQYIGITETSDPCFVPDWETKLLNANIIISKELSVEMQAKLLAVQDRVIFHHTVTGQGGTVLEPGVALPEYEFHKFESLIEQGFPISHYVLRIDPIILFSKECQDNVISVLDMWSGYLKERSENIRCRISVIDLYPHVLERIDADGRIKPIWRTFKAPPAVFRRIESILEKYTDTFDFECCAEQDFDVPFIHQCGCASSKDIQILGQDTLEFENPSHPQRKGCMCLAKKQILACKPGRCDHKCLYCFWK